MIRGTNSRIFGAAARDCRRSVNRADTEPSGIAYLRFSDCLTVRLSTPSVSPAADLKTILRSTGSEPGSSRSPALTFAALKGAKKARLQVPVPVSTVQMEYICRRKPAAVLQLISAVVARCRELTDDVEFIAEDAGRSEPEFLRRAIDAAVQTGAATVTVCDTAGTLLPEEFYGTVKEIRAFVPEQIRLGIQCSNALYMADACGVSAVRAGADEVKTVSCGDDTAALDKLVRVLTARGESLNAVCSVRTTELQRVTGQIRRMCETNRSSRSPFDNGVQSDSEDTTLTSADDRGSLSRLAVRMGYDLSEEDLEKVYAAFLSLVSKKETVTVRELDAIIASAAMQVPPTYLVESYVINSGNIITATAHMRLKKGERTLESVCLGDGPIDAAFLAIEQIVGRHFELDDFQIQAVTEGREAMGETVVRLRSGGRLYSGRGISTDIVGSGVQAYLNAVNKIVFEEGER